MEAPHKGRDGIWFWTLAAGLMVILGFISLSAKHSLPQKAGASRIAPSVTDTDALIVFMALSCGAPDQVRKRLDGPCEERLQELCRRNLDIRQAIAQLQVEATKGRCAWVEAR
jgi:hypothetical protein